MSRVFISYSREDADMADRVYQDLQEAGHSPWLDRVDLVGGESWRDRIKVEIRECEYFLALLSSGALNKRGYFHSELRTALSVIEELPLNQRFLLPVRLDDCEIRHPSLMDLHRIDLFPEYYRGLKELLRALGKKRTKPGRLYSEVGVEVPTDLSKWDEVRREEFIRTVLWPEALNRAERDYLNVEVRNRPAAVRRLAREKTLAVAERFGIGKMAREWLAMSR